MVTEYNIEELFKKAFGSQPYKVPGLPAPGESGSAYKLDSSQNQLTQITGSTLLTQFNGVEIWLPVWFEDLPASIIKSQRLFFPYTVVKISGKKTIIKTTLAERRGTVKEQYNIDDYSISIKGFLIDAGRQWPEQELKDLKSLYELNASFRLNNALTNIFLSESDRVVIESIELPEVEGGRKHVRPFSMQLESDSVFELELNV